MKKITLFTLSMFFLIVRAPENNMPRIEIPLYHRPQELYKIIEEKAGVRIPDHVDLEHVYLMYSKACELDIPINILFRLVKKESGFNLDAISVKGAQGYFQVMPETYLYMLEKLNYPLDTPHTPEVNIIVGVEYLAYLRRCWRDRDILDIELWNYILASYNAGYGRVIAYNGIPPFQETINYIKFIQNEI